MASKYWIKLYHEILDDPKMGRMPDRLWRRTIELFLLAGELDDDGALPEIKDMAWRLRIDDDSLTDDLAYLTNYGIVHQEGNRFVVSKFIERQAPMTDTERMQRYRDKKRQDKYYGEQPVTKRNGNVTVNRNGSLVDTDIDIDIDTELKKGADLFDACVAIFEKKKGAPITDGQAFTLMINNFKANGVTSEDYSAAIDAMDADPRYKGNKPTSYEKWAIGYADKRRNPTPTRTTQPIDNLALLERMHANGEL